MRTKWQSGSAVGNAAPGRRTGNRPIGNEGCAPGKSSPYLSRKIYLICCRRLAFSAADQYPSLKYWDGYFACLGDFEEGLVMKKRGVLTLLVLLACRCV